MGYLAAAYAVFWVVTFFFVIRITLHQNRLQREIEALKQALEKDDGGAKL